MEGFRLKDKHFLFIVTFFLIILLYEIFEYFSIINFYPLRIVTDLNTYMIRMHFLKVYGFHNLVPNISGGALLYYAYPVGWGFFNLPMYLITGNILLTTFLSTVIIFSLTFLVFYIIGRIQKFSLVKIAVFFLLFFANPLMLDTIFHVGRGSEHIGWLSFSIFFFFIMFYRDRKIGLSSLLILILVYSVLLLTHIYLFVIGSILLGSLFLVKDLKEKLLVIIIGIVSLILTSFWWIPFNLYASRVIDKWSIKSELLSAGLFSKHILFSYSTLSILLLFGVFYLYCLSNRDNLKREFIFYLPPVLVAFLVLIGLIIYVPIFNSVPYNAYTLFFIFISIFLFLDIKKFSINKSYKKYFIFLLVLLPLISIGFFIYNYHDSDLFYIHPYKYTDQDIDVLEIMKDIKDPFMFLTEVRDRGGGDLVPLHIDWPYSDYAVIYYNKSKISQPYSWYLVNEDISNEITEVYNLYWNGDCSGLVNKLNSLGIKTIVSYEPYCVKVESCGLIKNSNGKACIFYL